MKKVFKKNRLVILALSVMIGVAGYLNFNESNKNNLTTKEDSKKADMEVISYEENTKADGEADLASSDDISKPTEEVATDKSLEQAAIEENIQLNSDEENIGEAVLTNAEVVNNSLAMIQLNREQSRSRTKEYLLSIINDDAIEESAKQEATAAYVKLSDNIEKETDAETLLAAKGYNAAIVTISDESVDVALNVETISDTERAQIEDIVTRKTGYDISQVVISVLSNK
ncbi:MAG: SpoIIIAH-like family protein [Coprococcus sp.]|nr:SpoIIIAH-like family protein [Coprococcus sp.]